MELGPQLWTSENFATAHRPLHVWSALMWTLSVTNWRRSSVTSLSHRASTFVYNTMDVRHAARRAGLFAADETCETEMGH